MCSRFRVHATAGGLDVDGNAGYVRGRPRGCTGSRRARNSPRGLARCCSRAAGNDDCGQVVQRHPRGDGARAEPLGHVPRHVRAKERIEGTGVAGAGQRMVNSDSGDSASHTSTIATWITRRVSADRVRLVLTRRNRAGSDERVGVGGRRCAVHHASSHVRCDRCRRRCLQLRRENENGVARAGAPLDNATRLASRMTNGAYSRGGRTRLLAGEVGTRGNRDLRFQRPASPGPLRASAPQCRGMKQRPSWVCSL